MDGGGSKSEGGTICDDHLGVTIVFTSLTELISGSHQIINVINESFLIH